MTNRRIEMYEYRQIIYRLRLGQSEREIARDVIAGRKVIHRIKLTAENEGWLSPAKPLPDESILRQCLSSATAVKQESSLKIHEAEIKKWVTQGIQATVIYRYLSDNYDLKLHYNAVQRFVKKLNDAEPVSMTVPLHFKPGEAAQVDFGKGPQLLDERTGEEVETWFFVMTLCWSRHQYVELVVHQDIETWLNCHQNAFNWFGGVVGKVIIDNPKCAITKACYHDPQTQRSYEAFAESYGFIISACPPREPKKKGRVESGVKYVKNNFLPLRELLSLQKGNSQLRHWCLTTAGNRTHGSTFEKPLIQFTEIEQALLKPLPVTPPEIAVWQKVMLYKDCHVRYLKCSYSAPHVLYGKPLWLKASSTTVSLYHEHELVAFHPRLFKPGQYSTQDGHLPPNARFYLERDPAWCLEKSQQVGEGCRFVIDNLLTDPVRDLLRQAQSVLSLASTYGERRLELACQRAIAFHSPCYKTIKTILKEGLDYSQLPLQEAFSELGSVYQGKATFQRTINELLH